jgi:hypothetical protein
MLRQMVYERKADISEELLHLVFCVTRRVTTSFNLRASVYDSADRDSVIHSVRKRVKMCTQANGGCFEYLL